MSKVFRHSQLGDRLTSTYIAGLIATGLDVRNRAIVGIRPSVAVMFFGRHMRRLVATQIQLETVQRGHIKRADLYVHVS